MGKLSATAVKAATRPGRIGDGDGLYLVVKPSGTKSWMVRVQKHGNRRDFGLGSASKISLAIARERAREVRTWVELGLDPLFERRKAQGIPTFREATAKVLAQHRSTWRNEKHEKQWIRTLEAYAFPHLGNVQVNDITGPMIRNVLAEIWLSKPETARRVRQRIGTVLDWAYASGYRDSEAPMRAISKGLPSQPKQEGHFAAMSYAKVPAFIPRLRERESYSRLALEFAILTAARSGEVVAWLERRGGSVHDFLLPSRVNPHGHMSTRQYARLVDEWVTAIGLPKAEYGTHSLRRTKAAMIYRATGNIRAIQILLGHTKIENTVRYLGVDVEDALLLAERTEI